MSWITNLLLACAIATVGCATSGAGRSNANTPQTEVNKKVAQRFFAEVLNEGRYEVASELYAPDFRNGTSTADEDIQAAKGWRDAFPDMRFDVEQLIAEGEYVSVFWRARGTNTGTGSGISATGRSMDVHGVTIWRLVDARLKQEWTIMNEATVKRQLGLGCEPAMF